MTRNETNKQICQDEQRIHDVVVRLVDAKKTKGKIVRDETGSCGTPWLQQTCEHQASHALPDRSDKSEESLHEGYGRGPSPSTSHASASNSSSPSSPGFGSPPPFEPSTQLDQSPTFSVICTRSSNQRRLAACIIYKHD